MGGQKRRLRQRVKEVGEQVEESIRQAGEEQKLQHVAADQLFQVDSTGGDAPLSKRQKLQIKDPLIKSRKFDAAKASRFETERLKKLKASQEAAAAKPAATQRKAETKKPALPWGQEEQPDADDYVAPALTAHQPAKRRKKVAASTRHRVSKVEVPAAGQSYHPDFEAHQDVMASAVAEELERRELRAKMAEPVRAGLSEETLQFINDKDSVRYCEAGADAVDTDADLCPMG
jgi:nucleolar protein 53